MKTKVLTAIICRTEAHLGKLTPVILSLAVLLTGLSISPSTGATTITVLNNNDNGSGSLRQAVASAGSGDSIVFAPAVTGTIALTGGELDVNQNLTVTGPGAATLAISGSTNSRVFNIGSNVTVTISSLTICNGHTTNGANGLTVGNVGQPGNPGGGIGLWRNCSPP